MTANTDRVWHRADDQPQLHPAEHCRTDDACDVVGTDADIAKLAERVLGGLKGCNVPAGMQTTPSLVPVDQRDADAQLEFVRRAVTYGLLTSSWLPERDAARDARIAAKALAEALLLLDPCQGGEEPHERHTDVCVPFYDLASSLMADDVLDTIDRLRAAKAGEPRD